MGKPVNLPTELYENARLAAAARKRTIPQQIAHWCEIARWYEQTRLRAASAAAAPPNAAAPPANDQQLQDPVFLDILELLVGPGNEAQRASFREAVSSPDKPMYGVDDNHPGKILAVYPDGRRELGVMGPAGFEPDPPERATTPTAPARGGPAV